MVEEVRDASLEMAGVDPKNVKPYSRPAWLGAESDTSEIASVERAKQERKNLEEEQLRAGFEGRKVAKATVNLTVMPLGGIQISHPKEDVPS